MCSKISCLAEVLYLRQIPPVGAVSNPFPSCGELLSPGKTETDHKPQGCNKRGRSCNPKHFFVCATGTDGPILRDIDQSQ